MDLMYDGFYLLFLLRAKQGPSSAEAFRDRIKDFLAFVDREGAKLGATSKDIHLCKYAFCATVDETILLSQFKVRDAWQIQPLQLQFFGEQLAGEKFFEELDKLRQEGVSRIHILEIFHMCLLMGFQGKYIIEGSEKLAYLISTLGEEIARLKGSRAPFTQHPLAPDAITHRLRHDVPLWVIGSVFAFLGMIAFAGMNWGLGRTTQKKMASYHEIVKLAPQAANVTITLP